MTPSIEKKIKEITERAKREGIKNLKPRTAIQNGSSLHMIIRTKEQADRFMKSLRDADKP